MGKESGLFLCSSPAPAPSAALNADSKCYEKEYLICEEEIEVLKLTMDALGIQLPYHPGDLTLIRTLEGRR
ncbi:hypothetical protein [Paenibacillus lacisoli]|uniref:hypothetical protein n=1 Tax=Paenibacillus lacisoli TaxID=3064525 RepID=UPI002729B04D|nr:hypothetical protein [Paenibacillus sp. JX-17]